MSASKGNIFRVQSIPTLLWGLRKCPEKVTFMLRQGRVAVGQEMMEEGVV